MRIETTLFSLKHVTSDCFSFVHTTNIDDGCHNAARLVVENLDQRQRIVSLTVTHDDGHFGVNRANSTITSKYYWPGLYTDVKSYVRL